MSAMTGPDVMSRSMLSELLLIFSVFTLVLLFSMTWVLVRPLRLYGLQILLCAAMLGFAASLWLR